MHKACKDVKCMLTNTKIFNFRRASHSDIAIIAIMMIHSIILTPILPNEDQEKAPATVERACRVKSQDS